MRRQIPASTLPIAVQQTNFLMRSSSFECRESSFVGKHRNLITPLL